MSIMLLGAFSVHAARQSLRTHVIQDSRLTLSDGEEVIATTKVKSGVVRWPISMDP